MPSLWKDWRGNPLGRVASAIQAMLDTLSTGLQPAAIRTLTQAVELIERLLEPAAFERAATLPIPAVLAVVDDVDLLATIVASLEVSQLQTTGCADPAEALAIGDDKKFDLILLDYHLGGIDGPEVCAHFRATGAHRKTPIVFLTIADRLDTRAQASLSGATDFLPKPFHTAELALKAHTWIGRGAGDRFEKPARDALMAGSVSL